MTAVCGSAGVAAAIIAAAGVIETHRTELTALDQEIGDGDHGENLSRGFSAVVTKLGSAPGDSPGAVLKLVASTLISTVGGASGPLFGTAFLRAATSVTDGQFSPAEIAKALVAARDGVMARGKAEVGEKTMVDALAPAADAATAAADGGADTCAVLSAAAEAAEAGAESTVPLQARKGRASYLGERSIGHVDPGAQSTAYLLRALADAAAGRAGS